MCLWSDGRYFRKGKVRRNKERTTDIQAVRALVSEGSKSIEVIDKAIISICSG